MLSAELCRVCGSDAVSSDLTSIFIKRENVDCIADIILELSGLLATAHDGLPQRCCTVCQADLMTAINVRRRCLEMDKKFRISLSSIPSCDTSEAPDASLCLENNLDKAAVAPQDDLDTAHKSCGIGKETRHKVPFETDKQTNRSLDADRIEAAKVDGILDKQCCGCSERFSSEEELRAHSEKTHALEPPPSTEARPFQCGICYRWFKSARGVLEHRSDRRNRRYQCATCGQRFSRPSRLAVHENLHSKAKAFACELCGETFHNLYARRVHIRKSHGGAAKDGPVTTGNECQQCGKTFRSASYLKSHQKLHANEAPHKCTVCGAQFKLPVYLKWHMKIHSGTYSCNHCNLAFKGPFDLREHQNRHIGYKEFVCTSCDKNFYTKKELNKHERRTHERKPKAAKS